MYQKSPTDATQNRTAAIAASVEGRFRAGRETKQRALGLVVQCSVGPVVPVYNLTVEGAHEYFANNILVHNCDALVQGLSILRESFPSGNREADKGFMDGDGVRARVTAV